ncbi:hypothetical protein NKH70_22795 [Mesorhizobium sp. M0991]|uniref:hypothetical protein n=1 Tax=Mesorhizobium sp. M0991 TaxID=2957043 RepID=UPI0033359D6F
MNAAVEVSADGSRLTVKLPLTVRKRGGRKVVIAPHGAIIKSPRPRVDNTLVKAIARAYRWQRMLEEGAHASMRDLAAAEHISPTYISRLLRLTLLDPQIVEAVLDRRHPEAATQELLFQPLPDVWWSQQQIVCATGA